MTTRTNQRPAVVLALSLAVLAACGGEDPESVASSGTAISVHTVEASLIQGRQQIEVRGVVHPLRQAFVSSRVSGPVVAVHVAAGDRVQEGAVLLEIQPETSQGQLAEAGGALSQAEAALSLAERNYQRFQALYEEDAASELELDQARMHYEQAKGALSRARGGVRSAEAMAAEAVVRAPFRARVVDTMVEVGDLATPGRPLAQVESLEGQQIWLVVGERDISRLAVDQEVTVRIDARPDLGTMSGRVDEIIPTADPATHSFNVKVDLEGVQVPSGLSGRATIEGEQVARIGIPVDAVHRRGGLELVVVRAQDGTARTHAVTTGGRLDGDLVEILSGLEPGDEIVVDAPGPVADGTPLEVVP